MKQVLQNLRTGEIVVAEVPVPALKPGMVLVRTAVSLVSAGTERMVVEFAEKSLVGKARSRPDLVRQMLDKAKREGWLTAVEAAFTRLDQPLPLGYSSSGIVVALGEGVENLRPGQRVACAGGGYAVHAEYNLVPRNLIVPLPDQVDFESAAFTTLGAIALHGFRLAEVQIGGRVAVIGLGLLGLLSAAIATAAGCKVLGVDLDPQRVALARLIGAEAVQREHAEEAALSFSFGRGCDAILICADTPSADPVQLAGAIARDRARVVAVGAVGLSLPRKTYYEKELFFVNSRSYGPGRYDPSYEEGGQDYPIGYVRWTEGRNLEAFVDLLADGRVDVRPLITHRFPVENASQAYQLITGKTKEPFLGVLFTYPTTLAEPISLVSYPVSTEDRQKAVPTAAIVKLGVLGAGNFASTVLLPVLKKTPEVELVGVASASGSSASHAARRFGFRYATSQEEQIFNDPEINAVAILTRHHLHARQVVAALRAGKHVFCEKPLAIRSEQLSMIREQLMHFAGGGPLLMVGFNRRFAPLAQRLRAFFSERSEPMMIHYRVNAGYLPLNHWLHDPEQGGGRIVGEGCHFIDFLTFLVGELPLTVCVEALPDDGRYRGDNIVMTLTYADGSVGSITYVANGDRSFAKERVEVFAQGRVGVLDDFRYLELSHRGQRKVWRSRLRQDKGHAAEWRAFVLAVTQGGEPPIPYKHLMGVAQATLVAVEALRSGQRVIITYD